MTDFPHSLLDDWRHDDPNQIPASPDRYRCVVNQKARILCGPCMLRLGGYAIAHRAETDELCDECGAGGDEVQLPLL